MRLEELGRELLLELGEDPDTPGLQDTPRRWAQALLDLTTDPNGTATLDTTFESYTSGDLVALHGLRVWSLCEHHLLPFDCTLSIGYVPQDKVLGISKLARIAHKHAHRLQLQERLVGDVAAELLTVLEHPDIAVIGTGTHLCLAMRGAQADARYTCSTMLGAFRHDPRLRGEFLQLAVAR